MNLKISPLAYINKIKDDYVVGFGSKQDIIDEILYNKIKGLLSYIDKENDLNRVKKYLSYNNLSIDLLSYCFEKKLITSDNFSCYEEDFIYKNLLYLSTYFSQPLKIINEIMNMTFVFIGCGGIGSHMAYSLASYKPIKIILIDHDKVSATNLNRQFLFEKSDIGKFKTDVIKEKLEKRFNGNYISINKEFTLGMQDDYFTSIDNAFLIVSGDSNNLVKDASILSNKMNIPSLNVGYLDDISCIGPFFIPGKTYCPLCGDIGSLYNDEFEKEVRFINTNYESPASYPNCAIASSMAIVDIFHYLNGDLNKVNSINKRIGISNFNFEKLELDIVKKDKCLVCG